MKKTSTDVFILHMCTKNHDHMYASWNNGVWQTLTTQKIKILKKCKTRQDIIILHKCTKNNDHMLYCFSDITRDEFNCYFPIWAMFCPFTPLTAPQKHNFTEAYQKFWSDVPFLRYRARWTGGQTEERKDSRTDGKSGILKLVPHLIMHHSNWKFQNGLPHETGPGSCIGSIEEPSWKSIK